MANCTGERQASLSSDKLLAILECIAESRMPMRLQDLAERSGMSQSTVLRYLRTLQNANYVYQDEQTLRYALTWKLCGLTEHLNSYLGLRNIATPFVNQLANDLRAGVCLVVSQDYHCLYLDCIDHPDTAGAPLQFIGKRAPLHVTSSGKMLLSACTQAQIDDYIAQKGLTRYTDNSITTRERLMEELDAIRTQGFSTDMEECEIGHRCVSYPIYCYNGTVYAALSVFGDVACMNEEFVRQLHPQMKAVAEEISRRLGYDG